MAEQNTNNVITKDWMDEYTKGQKAALAPLKDAPAVRTLSQAPGSDTLTYTIGEGTEAVAYPFKIGDEVRVPDAENAEEGTNGFVYYKLYDITDDGNGNKTAYWALGGAGGSGGGALGKVKVYLKDIINGAESQSPSFDGVVVTLQNTTDSGAEPVTKTIAAGETSCVFTKVTPLKDYSVSVSALDSQHTAPAAQTITNLAIGDERELTFRYEADEYTAVISSNQGASDTAVSGAWLRASYTLDGQTVNSSNMTDGQTWKVPHGVTLSVGASSNVTGYSKQTGVDTTNKLLTAAYSTTKVNLQMVGVVNGTEGAYPTGAAGTVKYSGGTDQVLSDNTSQALVPTGTAFTVDYSEVSNYGTPATYSGTATGTAMTATKAQYVYGMLTVNVTNNDQDDTDLQKAKVYITVGSGQEKELTGTLKSHTMRFEKAVVPGAQYSVRYGTVEGYDTPATVSGTMPAAGTDTLSAQYATTPHTVVITSNQTNDSTIAAKRATLSYTYGGSSHQQTGIASGASVKVPANGVTNLAVTADDVTGYAKSVSNVGTAYTVSYTTMRLTVALAYQGETAPDLTGATVTVTDTTASAAVAKTDGVYLIPGGHAYKVEVSDDVEGYKAPDAVTGTATSGTDAALTVTMTYEEQKGFVDLGLPSGKKWAIGNLVKDSQGNYSIGEETDWGTYVSWGNIIGHNEGEGYDFSDANYDSTPGKQVAANIPGNDAAHDIALATLGTPWHMPTKEDFQELYDNTDSEWVADYLGTGVAGRKFMKKSDHSVYVFFPASGLYNGTSLNNRGTYGFYWPSSFYSATSAYRLNFNSSSVLPQDSSSRRFGFTVRPVQSSMRTVTITVTGDTVEGVSLTLTDSDGVQHTATTDASGKAEFTLVAYGSATLSAAGKSFSPSTVTVSASSGSFTVEMSERFVDLGLPSGLKWAQGNIIKNGDNYEIGAETDYGAYVSWGNIVPHFSSNGSTFDDGYNWGSNNTGPYASTPGAGIAFTSQGEGFSEDSGYDAARELLGGKWKMPTTLDFKELNDNCTSTWVTDYNGSGVAGRLFTSKINGATLFFPAAGYGYSSSLYRRGSYGRYWSRSLYSSDSGYYLYFDSSSVGPQSSYCRYYGFSVRAVQ